MKKIILLVLLTSLFLLSSCSLPSRGGNPVENIYTGTDGLVVKFLEQAPPGEVYETGEFDVQAFISNKGAFSLRDNYSARLSLIYDKAKLKLITDQISGYYRSTYSNKKNISLFGKSYYYSAGEQNYFAIDRFRARNILGNFETAYTNFGLGVCYPYQTTFADEICVDTNTQKVDPRFDACQAEDKTYSGGQGAPIAVTAVDVLMIPRGVFVQPTFVIYIKNMGNGFVTELKDEALEQIDPSSSRKTCGNLEKSNANVLTATAYLGNEKLVCTKPVLKKGEGRIECQLQESKISGNTANYLTSLRVKIDYIYSQSFVKKIGIKQADISVLDSIQPLGEEFCASWQTFDGKYCVDTCDYYAKNNPTMLSTKGIDSQGQSLSEASCIYTDYSTCDKAGDLCLTDSLNLCQTDQYCGLPACLNNNKRPHLITRDKYNYPTVKVDWFCNDLDDKLDKKQTCGCSEKGYYLFIDKAASCNDVDPNNMKETTGKFNPLYGTKYALNYPDTTKKLCVMVKDKLGEQSRITRLDI